MKRGLVVIAWFVVVAAVGAAQTVDAPATARVVGEALARGRGGDVYPRFTPQMKAALPEAALPVLSTQLFGSAGAFEAVDRDPVCQPIQAVQSCVVVLRFEKSRMSLRITVLGDGQVGGLFPAGAEPRMDRLGTSLAIRAGAVSLPAILTLPQGSGPFPVVVLVHGSGPLDVDETVGANKPFLDLAEGLATRGVGTLRYFKRSNVTPLGPDATLEAETIDDAMSALALAREQPRVDRTRVFLLGHSLGGYLGPYIASRDSAVRGLIQFAGNNRPMRDTVTDQVRHVTGSDAAFEAVWQGLPRRYRDGLPGYDPIAVAAALTVPVLVLQGGRDYQVTTVDFDRWKTALAGHRDATFHLYPSLNHLFLSGTGPSMPVEYGVASRIPAEVLDDIATWVLARR